MIQQRFSSSLILPEALVSSSGTGQRCPLFEVVHPANHGIIYPQRCPKGRFWRGCHGVTCLNHASFCLLTAAERGSCGLTRKLILLRTQSLVLCCKQELRRSFLEHWGSKAWILFFRVSMQGPCFTAIEEDGGDKRFMQLELAVHRS